MAGNRAWSRTGKTRARRAAPGQDSSEEKRYFMHLPLYDPDEVLDDLEDQIIRYLKRCIKRRKNTPYISALLLDTSDISTQVIDGHVGGEDRASSKSVLITAHYKGGRIGSAVAFRPCPRQLHRAIAEAEQAAWDSSCVKKRTYLMHPKKPALEKRFRLDLDSFRDKTYAELSAKLTECEEAIASVHGVIGSQALLEMTLGQEIFADSLGRRTIQDIARMHIHLLAEAEADDMPRGRFDLEEIVGCSGTAKDLDWLLARAKRKAMNLGERTVRFANAEPVVKPRTIAGRRYKAFKLKGGEYDVVMDGAMASLTIHELGAGHTAEAERFLNEDGTGEPFTKNTRVGIRSLNIVDNPLMKFRYVPSKEDIKDAKKNGGYLPDRIKPTSYYHVDHEGTLGGITYLVEKGIFRTYLTSKVSAGTLDRGLIRKLLTGNGRLGAVYEEDDGEYEPNPPLSRMSTLSILPDPDGPGLEGLLKEVAGHGLYITTGKGRGEVRTEVSQGWVGAVEVYFVDHDLTLIPLRCPRRRITIIDNAVGYMGKIKKIGNESTVSYESGWCVSGSGTIPQSCGGAAILVKGVKILPRMYEDVHSKPLTPIPPRRKTER